ncbi:hypothetical protein TNCT_400421 [Trichonephila clavata]|uniref:Uncharacterized protein n=1 Tax=Trichonephila clavata TaxID=2740835 RepID=A0A8X6FR37_TRICU|nr:hypothetical protein TNCT_400421 [Trichonephila clavata]
MPFFFNEDDNTDPVMALRIVTCSKVSSYLNLDNDSVLRLLFLRRNMLLRLMDSAYSPETVCLPDSDAAVPITPIVPVDVAIVHIPDENGSPVRVLGAINGRDETTLDVSLFVTPNTPRPASPLTFPDDPVPAFLLTILDRSCTSLPTDLSR